MKQKNSDVTFDITILGPARESGKSLVAVTILGEDPLLVSYVDFLNMFAQAGYHLLTEDSAEYISIEVIMPDYLSNHGVKSDTMLIFYDSDSNSDTESSYFVNIIAVTNCSTLKMSCDAKMVMHYDEGTSFVFEVDL